MSIEQKISQYLTRCAKFEYFLINHNLELGSIRNIGALQKIEGINWGKLAALIEEKIPYARFDFSKSGFSFFQSDAPQFLVKKDGKLEWDSDAPTINSWDKLLTRCFAQLRNNIAHGNKSHLPSQFTADRTEKFIEAGAALMTFISSDVLGVSAWEEPIVFQ